MKDEKECEERETCREKRVVNHKTANHVMLEVEYPDILDFFS